MVSLLSPSTYLSGLPVQWCWEGWQALELRGEWAVPKMNLQKTQVLTVAHLGDAGAHCLNENRGIQI